MAQKRETTRGMLPFKPKSNTASGPEAKIRAAIIEKLESAGWFVKITHGNAYQSGFPDLFCAHENHGIRLIEVKTPGAFSFTPAQQQDFPKFKKAGVGIWILMSAEDDELMKIHRPANWWEVYYRWVNGIRT